MFSEIQLNVTLNELTEHHFDYVKITIVDRLKKLRFSEEKMSGFYTTVGRTTIFQDAKNF